MDHAEFPLPDAVAVPLVDKLAGFIEVYNARPLDGLVSHVRAVPVLRLAARIATGGKMVNRRTVLKAGVTTVAGALVISGRRLRG
jgi:hypothetical protein